MSDRARIERYPALVNSAQGPAPSQQRVGAIMVALSGIGFGTLSVFSRSALATGLTVPQMLCLRFLGGALVLWAIAVLRRDVKRLSGPQLLRFGAMGLFFVGEAWLYFESSQRIAVALTALLLYLFPAMVVAASWAIFRQAPGRGGLWALGLSSVGIALAIGGPEGRIDATGVLLGAGSAVSYAVYILLGARAPAEVSPLFASALVMSMAALLFGLVAALSGTTELGALEHAWPPLVGIVGLGTVLPIPLLLLGMRRIGAARASIISTLEPVTSALCGAVFLHEHLGAVQLAGAALVVGASIVAASARR